MPFVDQVSYQPAFAIFPIPGYRVAVVVGEHTYVGKVVHSEITHHHGELMTLKFSDGYPRKFYRNALLQLANQATALTISPPEIE